MSGLCYVIYRLKKNGYFVVLLIQIGNVLFYNLLIYSLSINIYCTQNLYFSLGFTNVILNYFIYNNL
jgi:hypothetical protein